jgi:hypothetical protein
VNKRLIFIFLLTAFSIGKLSAQGLEEARNVLRVDSLSKEDRQIYKRYLEGLSLAMSLDDSSRTEGYFDGFGAGQELGRAEGEKLGIEKGRAEGGKQKAYDMARMMKADGEPVEKIMRYSGLTIDEISKL